MRGTGRLVRRLIQDGGEAVQVAGSSSNMAARTHLGDLSVSVSTAC